jgi:hypothetical protein
MSDYLFARPSLIEGIGRNIDLFGVMDEYNTSESGQDSDARALSADWAVVYGDMAKAWEDTKCQINVSLPRQ